MSMPPTTFATLSKGPDPLQATADTLALVRSRVGECPVRAGMVFSRGLARDAVARALTSAFPGVALVGAASEAAVAASGACEDAAPALAAWWLLGEGYTVSVATAASSPSGKELAQTAVERAGIEAFQTRFAVLLQDDTPLSSGLFEMLPKGAAFLGAELAGVWTHEGPASAALLISDWPTRLATGLEGDSLAEAAKTGLKRKGIDPTKVVGGLLFETRSDRDLNLGNPAPYVAAVARRLHGVPGRSPVTITAGALLLSTVKERAEG
ncbi:MAG: hypothetical protein HY901_10555 [Deltaproteobacteria bacterium]|nr:hypothetical protein [Deltaproteobacteria bacterium]